MSPLKKIMAWLRPPELARMRPQWRAEFKDKTFETNLERLRVFALVMVGLGLFYVAFSLFPIRAAAGERPYLYLDLGLVVASLAAWACAGRLLKARPVLARGRARILLVSYLVLVALWAGLVAGLEQQTTGGMISLVIGAFFLATFFYLASRFFLGLLVLSLAVYAVFSAVLGHGPWVILGNDATPAVLILLAWVSSRVLYRARAKNFVDQKLLLMARQGLEDQVAERSRNLLAANEGLRREVERRKKTEAALRESQALLQAAMDHSQAGIAIADAPDGRLRYVNDAGLLIRGGSREEVVNGVGIERYVSSWRILHPDGAPLKDDEVPLARAVLYGEVSSRELVIRRSEAEDRVVMANAAPIRDDSGQVVAGIVVFHDITEQKRAEAERERLGQQLMQAQKLEAVGTLAGGIAHDFNNLLQAINGYTQLLLMDAPEGDPTRSSLKAIKEAGRRATRLVRQLLLFSRASASERRPVNLNHEVSQALELLGRAIPRMVEVECELAPDLWTVSADPLQVEQTVLNLGLNAADAMPEGGRIFIQTENVTLDEGCARQHLEARPGRYVLLSVTDTGHGIDMQTQEKIFEPFFTTKPLGKGTGLGLSSVYGIVKSHGGLIDCHSQPGQGAAFRIHLPAIQAPAQEAREQADQPPRGGGETILLVDDEVPIRDFASQALGRFGYQVLEAASGEEALEIYAGDHGIDLVVMDIGMPGMGGHRCLARLKEMDPAARVIIASGYPLEGHAGRALDAGAAGYVAKPYQLDELLRGVRAALDQGQ